MTDLVELFITASLTVVAYAVLANRMLKLGTALRTRALNCAAPLLLDERFPEELKVSIRSLLPMLAHARIGWVFALSPIPSFILSSKREGAAQNFVIPEHLTPKWQELKKLCIIAARLNGPAATFLFCLQVVIITFFMSSNALADILVRKATTPRHNGHQWRRGFAAR